MAIGDLNDLRLFAAVVANNGFSAASRALSIPKSRISRRIAALEGELGVRLVERSTRRFKVTELGQDIYRHARAALAEADTIQETAARLKSEPQGLVRISCPPNAERLIGAKLAPFLDRHPKLRLQMLISNRRVNIIEEGVDIAIRVREKLDTDADLQLKVVGHTVSRLVAAPSLLERLGEPKSLADLARFPTIGFGDQPGIERWSLVGPDRTEETVAHEPRFAAGDMAMIHRAAVDGIGIALLPDLQYRESVAAGRLKLLLDGWSSRQSTLHLVYTSRRGLLPGVRAVLDYLAEALSVCNFPT